MSKIGQFVYVHELKKFGFINEVLPDGRIKTVQILNSGTKQIDIVEVIDMVVEAIGFIRQLVILVKNFFAKPNKDGDRIIY